MFSPTAWTRAPGDAHCYSATDEGFHNSSNAVNTSVQNLPSILRNELCAHQSQFSGIIAVVFVFQLVSELPILHCRKLGNYVSAPRGQKIIRRIGDDSNISQYSCRCLGPYRVGSFRSLD